MQMKKKKKSIATQLNVTYFHLKKKILLVEYILSIQQSVQLTLNVRERNFFLTFLKRNCIHLWTLSSDLFQKQIIWETSFLPPFFH